MVTYKLLRDAESYDIPLYDFVICLLLTDQNL